MFLTTWKTEGMLVLLGGLVIGGAALDRVGAGAADSTQQKASESPKDDDTKKLQGTWYTASVESHGRNVPVERIVAKGVRLVVESDRWTLKEAQGDADKEFAVRLDPAKRPAALDFTYNSGENKGKTSLGIYELDGNTLRICVGEPGDPRPTKFDGGGDYTLEVFKREKPKAPDPATRPEKASYGYEPK